MVTNVKVVGRHPYSILSTKRGMKVCVVCVFPSLTAVTSSKMTCFEGLSSTTLSQLQSVARLAYQGTLNDQLIFHDVQDSIESLGMPNVLHVSVSMTCIW